jgi:hypothetical protein
MSEFCYLSDVHFRFLPLRAQRVSILGSREAIRGRVEYCLSELFVLDGGGGIGDLGREPGGITRGLGRRRFAHRGIDGGRIDPEIDEIYERAAERGVEPEKELSGERFEIRLPRTVRNGDDEAFLIEGDGLGALGQLGPGDAAPRREDERPAHLV